MKNIQVHATIYIKQDNLTEYRWGTVGKRRNNKTQVEDRGKEAKQRKLEKGRIE